MKGCVVAAAAVMTVLVVGGGTATAHSTTFSSEVTIEWADFEHPSVDGRDYFRGNVTSDKNPCEGNFRTLKVFRELGAADQLVATTFTYPGPPASAQPRGFWYQEVEDPGSGTYYARAAKRDLDERRAHAHICTAARSPDLAVTDTHIPPE
jgi:hypothetical protein